MNKVKSKVLLSVVGLFGAAAFAPTAEAGGRCPAGKGGCAIGNAASQIEGRATAGAKTLTAPAETFTPTQPSIAPIDAKPLGQTYGRWAAEWWQWALGVPAAKNPVSDQTGQYCNQRQVGEVWFLAGAFTSNAVSRTCSIPAGKYLFFPLINILYGAFLSDPPETQTEAFVRAAGSCTEPAQISVKIDRFQVPKPTQYFTGRSGSQSPIFTVQMPPGNFIGDEAVVPELVLIPSAEQGYYLFIWPLKPGSHTIRWTATGCTAGGRQEITYHLNVVK